MGKRLFSLALVLLLVLGLVPAPAGAAGGPKLLCDDQTAAPGQYVSIDLRAEDLEALASVDAELYYDPAVFSLAWHGTGWLLDGAAVSVHTGEPGLIRLSAAAPGGISGSGTLLQLQFYVSPSAAPGTYPLALAVGDAYDAALRPVTVAADSGSITVLDVPPTHEEFRLGLSLSTDRPAPGESFTATVRNEWYYSFASCDVTFHYDPALFRLEQAAVSEDLQRSGVLYSLNTEEPGRVRLSCASTASLWCGDLLSITLQVLPDAAGTARLTAAATDVYDESRIPYQPGHAEADLTIQSIAAPVQPELRLEAERMVIGGQSGSLLVLGSGSHLAAADFRLEYDPKLVECLEVTAAAESGLVVINPNFQEGLIRFSYVNEAGAAGETPLVTILWQAREGADRHFTLTASLTDPVDPELKPVELLCPVQTECVYAPEHLEPTCTGAGGEALCCVGCQDRIPLDTIAPLGHDYGPPEFHWSADHAACSATRTCRRDNAHVWTVACAVTTESTSGSCTEPGSVTYTAAADFDGEVFTDSFTEDREVLGHDYLWTVLTEPGCETEGLRQGVCSRCADTREEAIAPLGHDWQNHVCARCGELRENPFTDVPEGSFYYDPVIWAVAKGITNGTTPTTFGPNDQCMRAHVVTFLWRAAGSPEPTSTHNPFEDVKQTDFYYKAVLWAVDNGITNGLDATHFGPFAYCNRAQVVTFLHRALGNPAPSSQHNPFEDVPEGSFYHKPVLWAVEMGVTNGLDAVHFGPNAICNRAQIVTFLYRAFT